MPAIIAVILMLSCFCVGCATKQDIDRAIAANNQNVVQSQIAERRNEILRELSPKFASAQEENEKMRVELIALQKKIDDLNLTLAATAKAVRKEADQKAADLSLQHKADQERLDKQMNTVLEAFPATVKGVEESIRTFREEMKKNNEASQKTISSLEIVQTRAIRRWEESAERVNGAMNALQKKQAELLAEIVKQEQRVGALQQLCARQYLLMEGTVDRQMTGLQAAKTELQKIRQSIESGPPPVSESKAEPPSREEPKADPTAQPEAKPKAEPQETAAPQPAQPAN
jgi:Skp family chaperone for outer membrane proteins